MNTAALPSANRILVIDDNQSIHADFRKILAPPKESEFALQAAEELLFGQPVSPTTRPVTVYEIDCASQGQEGFKMVQKASQEGRPYALAFVDVRMPPGWDGVETVTQIWQKYPELPVVICTAYSDYSWSEMMSKLGYSDNLVILRKPFEAVEVLQMAHSLTRKWLLGRQVRSHIEELDKLVQSRTRNLEEANDALRRSEERFAKAFRASPIALMLQSASDQRYVDVNDAFLQLTGFHREEVVGRTHVELNLFPELKFLWQIMQTLNERVPIANVQGALRTKDGKNLQILVSTQIFDLENRPHCLMSVQDITHRIHVEEQLRQAQKMEAVGQIAAGVAHDFNNILTVIQGHAELQLCGGELPEPTRESFQEINRASARAASLVRQLLAFSRKQMLHQRPLNVHAALDGLGKMLGRVLGETITLKIQCPDDLPHVFADAVNFEQIVINLAVNARDAMPEGGPLIISAMPVTIEADYKDKVPDAIPGNYVCLSVVDAGTGMDEAMRVKIFEPFFTTKEIGKGTGMGLATVYGIVKQHQGWIEVESTPGTGSVFKVFLPVSQDQTVPSPQPETRPAIGNGAPISKTILLVEDEAAVRDTAEKVLKRLGCQTIVAQDGPQALELWAQHRDKIDLLLTDMVMPGGLSGQDLAARILQEEPGLPVIYSTGYSAGFSNNNLPNSECVLLKPYDVSSLIDAINKALSKRTSGRLPAAVGQ
ncbi:MAG TPA: response regulator [Verrucomicrobiae bacterium]|jgi:PAS domain S-box-containing protein